MFVSIFSLVSLTTLEEKPVCHIYQWIARPTHGSVCNHCERNVDGFTLDDLIFHRDCSLTEDEVVAYVRRADQDATALGRLALAHNVSDQFLSQGKWFQY